MDLAHKIVGYYRDKGINIDYDPDSSTYRTWFGREVPISFDLDSWAIRGVYWKDTKEISLDPSFKLEKIAQNLIYEIGHANTSTGNTIYTDVTMIPAVYFASLLSQKAVNDDFDPLTIGINFCVLSYTFSYLISELLAEGYRLGKNILRDRKLNSLSPQ